MIKEVLEAYFSAWNQAISSKDGKLIRNFMSQNFVGYWAHANIQQPEPYFYDYDLNGVLIDLNHAKKSFEIYSITERGNGNQIIVLGRETNVINNVSYYAQCIFIWQKENDEWKLLREYIELENELFNIR